MATMAPADPGLSAIAQILVNAKDLERAIAFYRDTLGMNFLFQAPPNMAFFDCGGIRILVGIILLRLFTTEFATSRRPTNCSHRGASNLSSSPIWWRRCRPTISGWPIFAIQRETFWRF